MTAPGVDALAASLGVEPRALAALIAVEAPHGALAAPDGRPWLRVEAHLVLRRVPAGTRRGLRIRDVAGYWYGGRGPEPARPWEGHECEMDGAWSDYHRAERADGRPCEWDALDIAAGLLGSLGAAVECASWGPGQVLGRYWSALGYASAEALAEGDGLDLLGRALRTTHTAARAGLRSRDWAAVAAAWNGPGKAADYAAKLAKAYG